MILQTEVDYFRLSEVFIRIIRRLYPKDIENWQEPVHKHFPRQQKMATAPKEADE
ncbi:MAG TPA: hypothetical protein VI037_02885 [Nitrososphaera sp.]